MDISCAAENLWVDECVYIRPTSTPSTACAGVYCETTPRWVWLKERKRKRGEKGRVRFCTVWKAIALETTRANTDPVNQNIPSSHARNPIHSPFLHSATQYYNTIASTISLQDLAHVRPFELVSQPAVVVPGPDTCSPKMAP